MQRPRKPIRRFDIFAEYNRQKALVDGMPADEAKGYALWAAKAAAASPVGLHLESTPDSNNDKRWGSVNESPADKWLSLNGELQTDVLFDEEIIDRMGPEFYDQVFSPAIRSAVERGMNYADIRDSIREGWKI